MQKLVKILDQQFYYSVIENIHTLCSQKEISTIIIDDIYFDELLEKSKNSIGSNINQIIIISENINQIISKLVGLDVLLLAAQDLEEAINLAVLGEPLSNSVACFVKESEEVVSAILTEMTA
ncbi:MAG: hypothetical protein ACPGSO_04275 [Vicingaceae bacterium]